MLLYAETVISPRAMNHNLLHLYTPWFMQVIIAGLGQNRQAFMGRHLGFGYGHGVITREYCYATRMANANVESP